MVGMLKLYCLEDTHQTLTNRLLGNVFSFMYIHIGQHRPTFNNNNKSIPFGSLLSYIDFIV